MTAHDWAAVHARKLAAFQRLGVAVTFTLVLPGTYQESTGTFSGSPTTVTVTGYAVRIKGDPDMYAKLGLIETEAATLDFVPTTMGQRPPKLARAPFGSETFIVAEIFPFAPAGSDISSRIVVRR